MESFFSRYRNAVVLVAIVFVQIVALATQVKGIDPAHPETGRRVPLLRAWLIDIITPPERLLVHGGEAVRGFWNGYVDLRRVNRSNADLQAEIDRLRLDQVRWRQEAQQARRLEALLSFKEQYITETVAAQVVGTSGTDTSHIVYIDKGDDYGLRPDLPVITPDGVVGKVHEVYAHSAQVLLLNDQQSGIGVILEKSRRQGILKGSISGMLEIHYIMSDEKIEAGEKVYTSGGDRIFPKGLEVGAVTGTAPDNERDGFQLIRVKPNANLFRLEEVLVVTKVADAVPTDDQETPAQMLARRLPGIDTAAVSADSAENQPDKKTAQPPPVRPLKALQPDRFSPPEESASRGAGPLNSDADPVKKRKPKNAAPIIPKPEASAAAVLSNSAPQEH